MSLNTLIVKESNFFYTYIYIYIILFFLQKIINIINKIEKGPKIFDMYIVLFLSQNIKILLIKI